MYAEMLLRTTLVALSLFGLPLLVLAYSWRGEKATAAGEESTPRHRTWRL